jgi:predicted solute-binding protein
LKSLRIGCVKYLNARPLIRGWSGEVVLDHPAALCAQLARGDLDVALVSSFEFLRNPIYRIVDGISISSDGSVYSVFVAHSGEISQIEEVELDPAAETSVNLLRCLLAEFGLNPRLVSTCELDKRPQQDIPGSAGRQAANSPVGRIRPVADRTNSSGGEPPVARSLPATPNARLLIGDQAIRFRQTYAEEFHFWDLGEQWARLVDLPFVYAFWLVRPEVADPKPIADRLRAMHDENLAKLDKLIAQQKEFDPKFCDRYYRRHLRFNFGEREKEGLRAFHKLCQEHELLPKRDVAFTVV